MNINLFNNFYLNITIIFVLFIIVLNTIFDDINKRQINILILTNILTNSLFNIFIPIFFISGCYIFNFCISNDPYLESIIYIKAFRLTIIFLLGSLSGIILCKKYRIITLEKFINYKCIYLPANIRFGLYSTFLIISTILIISGFTIGDLYYNKLFSRIYNYYNWFLVTPTILFEISKNKLNDLKLLSFTYLLHGLVLFFGYGRTTNSITLIIFSIFVLLISTSQDLNIRDLIKIPFKNFTSTIISSTIFFILFSIARSKFIEIAESIIEYSEKVPKLMGFLLHGTIVLGFPLMNTWHMINAEKLDSNNIILTSTFWELITDIPLFGAIFKDSDIKVWVTKLPENLLGLNHQGEFGGYTFGSDFAYYSYADEFWSFSVSFIISLINMYIVFFLARNLSSIIRDYFMQENSSAINYSARPSIFLMSSFGLSSIVQNELFFSLITLIPFYLLGKYFSKK